MKEETTSIAEYSKTEAGLAVLREKYQGALYEVSTPAGFKLAISARAELRTLRVDLEKMRVAIKAPALERCRMIDGEAKRITEELISLEKPIDRQIKAEEARREAERQERERQERARLAAIAAQIEGIRRFPLDYIGDPSAEIAGALADLRATKIDHFDPPHRADAEAALAEAVGRLEEAHAAALAREEEAARLRAEREELERERAAQEAELAEQRRLAEEARAEADRLAQAERDRLDAEARAAAEVERQREAAERAERERVEAEARRAAEAKTRAEQARLEQQAAEQQAEAERLARERHELELAKRAKEIETVSLLDAAREAHALLVRESLGDALATVKLGAAIARAEAKA